MRMFQKKSKQENEIEAEKLKIIFQALENVISSKFHQYFDRYLIRFSKYFNAKAGFAKYGILTIVFFALLFLILLKG
jgi:hypothetical protein